MNISETEDERYGMAGYTQTQRSWVLPELFHRIPASVFWLMQAALGGDRAKKIAKSIKQTIENGNHP
jgi:hypothetical protein